MTCVPLAGPASLSLTLTLTRPKTEGAYGSVKRRRLKIGFWMNSKPSLTA